MSGHQKCFNGLVPKDIREHYDTLIECEKLYSLGADLQTLIAEKKWRLKLRFGRSYFVFWFGGERVFWC